MKILGAVVCFMAVAAFLDWAESVPLVDATLKRYLDDGTLISNIIIDDIGKWN